MTDLSKIDFTQLKLEPIGSLRTDVDTRGHLSVTLNGWSVAKRTTTGWVITSGANGLSRREVDELWKRTEQVDEFIKQQSRRRITILELVKLLVDTELSVKIEKDSGFRGTYRFNRRSSILEIYEHGEWRHSTGMGDSSEVVSILD